MSYKLKLLPITDINMFTSDKGAFTNYVDKILAFLDQQTPYVYIFYGTYERWQKVGDFGPPIYLVL